MPAEWELKGYLLGACSCDWGCPCSFNARPTKGFCEGGYVWVITKGRFAGTDLSGLHLSWMLHSPGPLHEGNCTSQVMVDERANPKQREALLQLTSGKEGLPWAIFAAVTKKFLDPLYAPFNVQLDGLKSKASAKPYLELELAPISNPVTGETEQLQLRKPTGFTSLWADLGVNKRLKINAPNLKYEHPNQYGEFSEFHYTQNGLR